MMIGPILSNFGNPEGWNGGSTPDPFGHMKCYEPENNK